MVSHDFCALFRVWFTTASVLLLAGCSTTTVRQGQELVQRGEFDAGIQLLEKAVAESPADTTARLALRSATEQYSSRLLSQAGVARSTGRLDEADALLRRASAINPRDERPRILLEEIRRAKVSQKLALQGRELHSRGQVEQALLLVESGLKENPLSPELLALQRELEQAQRQAHPASERLADTRPITVEFRDANFRMVIEAITRGTGVNVVVDRDVRPDLRITVFLRDARLEDALDLITGTNQLAKKVLNPTTVLVYPNTPEKAREYQDLMVRAFYLGSTDVRQAAQMLRTLLKIREPFVDEKLNLIVLRDSPETIRLAERLLLLHDQSDAEVMMEVEVLEVSSSRLTELGINWPDSFSLTVLPPGGGTLTLEDLRNTNSSNIGVTPPRVTLNFRRELGDLSVLANPRIRARNKEKARVMIGDKLPVITSTATSTGFVSESVQYIDVGLRIEVEPTVSLDDEVSIKVNLEVSNLVREIRTTTGSLVYQIGTRAATTTLRLRDGETQLLAGLISNADRKNSAGLPGLGELPVAGRLFSTKRDDAQRTEIVLSITPRIIRNVRRPELALAEFWSGTETQLRSRPLSSMASAGAATIPAPGRQQPGGPPGTEAVTAPAPMVAPGSEAATAAAALPSAAASTRPSSEGSPALPPDASKVAATPSPGPSEGKAEWSPPPSLHVGNEFSVPLGLQGGVQLRGLNVELRYDEQLVELIDVTPGPLLTGSGQPSLSRTAATSGAALAITAPGSPVPADGVIAVLRFRTKAPGRVELSATRLGPIGPTNPAATIAAPPPLRFVVER